MPWPITPASVPPCCLASPFLPPPLPCAAPGKQAEVLNKVIDELLDDHPVGEVKLKEVLGHTPRQVRGREGRWRGGAGRRRKGWSRRARCCSLLKGGEGAAAPPSGGRASLLGLALGREMAVVPSAGGRGGDGDGARAVPAKFLLAQGTDEAANCVAMCVLVLASVA